MNEVCHDSDPPQEPKIGVYWAGPSKRAVPLSPRPPPRSHPNSCDASFFPPRGTQQLPLPRFRAFPALSSSPTRGRTRNPSRRPPRASQKCTVHSVPRRRWPLRGEHAAAAFFLASSAATTMASSFCWNSAASTTCRSSSWAIRRSTSQGQPARPTAERRSTAGGGTA
jgi:hypothetical protein